MTKSPISILLVEDELESRLMIDLLLHLHPCEVDFVNDGLSAIQQACTKKYDCILMDLSLPYLTGIEASRVIKKILKSKALPVPAIFGLSEYINKHLIDECLDEGMISILFKPIKEHHIHRLFARLDQWETAKAT